MASLSIWLLLGWVILDWAKIGDSIQRGLLAPAVGMAATMLVTTTASFAGLPVKLSVLAVLILLALSVVLFKRATREGFTTAGSLHLLILLANLGSVGLGLLWFGESWQGLVNEDAATSSLAAQYFTEHAFFRVRMSKALLSGSIIPPFRQCFM